MQLLRISLVICSAFDWHADVNAIVSCLVDLHYHAGAVGIYVPGGTAVLPSSTLMMAVPAQIAGCRTVVMATPPRADGQVAFVSYLDCLSISDGLFHSWACLNLKSHCPEVALSDCVSVSAGSKASGGFLMWEVGCAGDTRGTVLCQEGWRDPCAQGGRRSGCGSPGMGHRVLSKG